MTVRKKATPPLAVPGEVPPVAQLPVTRAMLYGVRDELKARIDKLDARFAQVDARFAEINARFAQVDARFAHLEAKMDARFAQFDARIDEVRAELMAEIHRIGTLVEEQESRNRITLEVVQGHNERFTRIEAKLDAHDAMLREILDAVRKRP